ncbi:MAG: M20/M25/M40 family metallo-hydrolase [Anaerolineae bacterium]|nr:M20/M25/M40 family metallo-hydrolase [Anaerolineae bacterium]MCI0609017.1 M20/M25/M40 family metallo-hydrolase [Anaerolineae bacterium]
MTQSLALTYLEEHYDRFQGDLIDLLRIPSISNDPAYKNEMDKAANWLANKLRSMGINNVEILPTAGHSVVYGEWLNGGASAPTVLIYGHYDVQSPEPVDDWKSKPFEPVIRDENLYARGASDMKGQTLAAVNAVEAIVKSENLPINIKFLIEGEEEIGSKHLNDFLIAHREKLACDFSLNTDAGGMPDAETPSICYSLRGGVGFKLEIYGPSQDIHSGEYGGVIQNPIHVLSKLIADLHDEHGHVTLPGFYDKVRKIDEEEHAELSKLPFDEAFLLKHSGAPALWGEPEFIPAERIGARPTLEVVLFQAGQPKTAIPAKAVAGFSFRLVPDQDPNEVHRQFRQYLETNLPPTVTWDLQFFIGNPAVITNRKSPEVIAMKNALQIIFGKEPIFQRSGGGIGAVLMFKEILGVDSVLTGFSLYDDNFHGPNEKLHLPTWKKGMAALVHFFHNLVN